MDRNDARTGTKVNAKTETRKLENALDHSSQEGAVSGLAEGTISERILISHEETRFGGRAPCDMAPTSELPSPDRVRPGPKYIYT